MNPRIDAHRLHMVPCLRGEWFAFEIYLHSTAIYIYMYICIYVYNPKRSHKMPYPPAPPLTTYVFTGGGIIVNGSLAVRLVAVLVARRRSGGRDIILCGVWFGVCVRVCVCVCVEMQRIIDLRVSPHQNKL